MDCLCAKVTEMSKAFSCLLFLSLLLNCFGEFRSDAQVLPQQEVQALDAISKKLQIKHLNINESFCSSGRFLNETIPTKIVVNVTCNCSSTLCHVTNIQLKGQNLTGTLPPEFVNLSFLQEIDLSRNYINGSIPTFFPQLPLTILSLLGNRISGPIPKEIGDIATLEELILEDNQLGGTLPPNLGNLSSLRRLLLSANNFTGTIPATVGNLTNLEDFRIDGSSLSGKIPDLIGKWTKIRILNMQGTSMDGPIPSTISQLKNVEELRVSDLKGPNMQFPDLQQMKKLVYLILRNCLITGPIPDNIGELPALKTLDLSFNKLTGRIPGTFESLNLNQMLLSNNSLSGAVPNWAMNGQRYIDLSYNNFSESPASGCQSSMLNLVSSQSYAESNSISWCFKKDLPCPTTPRQYSLFVNCGGSKMNIDGNEYEEDSTQGGPSYFFSSAKWAYSSTGLYMGNDKASYRADNSFALNITGADFYRTARLAPNSLKYYGLCLRKGSYKVRLHFAEIMYSNDQTFSSIGKRIFDVSIQGNVVLKDFNIMEEAKGVGRGITKDFNDVYVNGSTLEIHLYWLGKGTTAIPDRGVYGPLISAISVTPNYDPHTGGLSVGAIVGIVAASCVLLAFVLFVLRMKGYLGGKDPEDKGDI